MNAKLTLKLDKDIIEKAKRYAKSRQTSLSFLVESYFKVLAGASPEENSEYSPTVRELSGIIELPEDFDAKAAYTDYLVEKYR